MVSDQYLQHWAPSDPLYELRGLTVTLMITITGAGGRTLFDVWITGRLHRSESYYYLNLPGGDYDDYVQFAPAAVVRRDGGNVYIQLRGARPRARFIAEL